jgi:hypothetical protein
MVLTTTGALRFHYFCGCNKGYGLVNFGTVASGRIQPYLNFSKNLRVCRQFRKQLISERLRQSPYKILYCAKMLECIFSNYRQIRLYQMWLIPICIIIYQQSI